jgi:integrase
VAVHRLTDRWLASCPPPPRGRLEFADGLCPGLRARITSKGKKSFSVVKWANGRQQRITIGRYPLLSLAEARAMTKEVLIGGSAILGPPAVEAPAEQTLTYAELADLYVERHLKPNTRSWRNVKSSLLRHPAVQHLLARPAASINLRELVEVVDSIAAAGTPQAAVNILRRLKMLFNWAVDRDLVPANPCERIRPPAKTVERDRVLTDAEIAAVWQASHQLPTPYGQMYRLFLLTGQRRSEVATMCWGEVQGDVWTIPREKVKKDRPHTVPLAGAAEDILAGLRRMPRVVDDNGFVFTTTGGKSASSNFAKVKRQLDALSGVTDWTIHDIRRTVRSKLAELGVPREVARKVLNHEDGKVDRIYNRHEYLAEKREALGRWERVLMNLAETPMAASWPPT